MHHLVTLEILVPAIPSALLTFISHDFSRYRHASVQNTEGSHMVNPLSGASSPRAQIQADPGHRRDDVEPSMASARVLSPDEIDTFLDLIYKHHPEPMTAETMRQSVDALYGDWEQYCARRQVPVRLAKKPLMDEYGKIFNGVYGPDAQSKARSIAHELSQRSANLLASMDAAGSQSDDQHRDSGSRRSATYSMTDRDSDDAPGDEDDNDDTDNVEANPDNATAATDAGALSVASEKRAEKYQDTTEGAPSSSATKKSNIAQVGRNGLAVLAPGLFDILRTHLRDEILSSIMPSVRNDLAEQTRELFLQNQDLFGRIKEMEDRIRNQDLWIRHLLSHDPSDMTTLSAGPHKGDTGMAGVDLSSRLISTFRREPVKSAQPLRHGPLSLEGDIGGSMAPADYFSGARPMSSSQDPRNDPRRLTDQGGAGPPPTEGLTAPAAPIPGNNPGIGAVSAAGFGSGLWEPEAHAPAAYRDRPLFTERRPSHANEPPHRRPGSWHSDVQPVRDFRSHSNEWHDNLEGRYEPPQGSFFRQQRLSSGGSRRSTALGGSGTAVAGPRSANLGPGPLPPTGSPRSMTSMHDDFRRPGTLMLSRDPVMSPFEPAYETRRVHPGLPVHQAEANLGGGEASKAPLPPRAMAVGSPEQKQRNKRGRPSKAEIASSRGELGAGGSHASFGADSHSSLPFRPYLS